MYPARRAKFSRMPGHANPTRNAMELIANALHRAHPYRVIHLAIGGLTIGAGQTDAIYVFDFGGYLNYNNGVTTFSNADLTFNGGTGNYGFFDNTLADRNWSGTINYSLSAVPEGSELSLMLAGVGLLGFAARRRRQA